MAFRRGDVVLIPFPYTDLSAAKTRPAVVVSSEAYHAARPELLLAYVSSQLSQADPTIDYVLADWKSAGLLKPSFVRAKVAAVELCPECHLRIQLDDEARTALEEKRGREWELECADGHVFSLIDCGQLPKVGVTINQAQQSIV